MYFVLRASARLLGHCISVDNSRWRFDLATGEAIADEDLCTVPCEFPVVNPAVVGLKTRYIWANVLVSEPSPLSSNGIMKYDVQQRDWSVHKFEGKAGSVLTLVATSIRAM